MGNDQKLGDEGTVLPRALRSPEDQRVRPVIPV